ncbi:hypothetical protein P261_00802 [Lachnospiraceae bacterium TWA4]|nr:hypothetical protein P261_00802 [Lachnospiraceae bacterium TWA4]
MTSDKIRDEFLKGYDCSQVVLRSVATELGITEDEANKMAACFGGGMQMGEICGAVIGAMIAIGLKYGHSDLENLAKEKEIMSKKSQEFREKFLSQYDSVICRKLLGYDLTKLEEAKEAIDSGRMMDFCPKLVEESIKILKEVL